jgi:hypothetical protein
MIGLRGTGDLVAEHDLAPDAGPVVPELVVRLCAGVGLDLLAW